MTTTPRSRRLAFLAAVSAIAIGLWASGSMPDAAQAEGAGKLVASTVCEAHELRARAEEDPHLEIEIPPAIASKMDVCLHSCLFFDSSSVIWTVLLPHMPHGVS